MDDKRRVSLFFFILVMCFFYLPIIILIIFSFNSSRGYSWEAFSLKWYIELFSESPALWSAIGRSIIIACCSSLVSVAIATLGAIGMKWYKTKITKLIKILNYIPLIIPDIIMGVSLLIFFTWEIWGALGIKIELGMGTIFIAHTTFSIPFALFIILARLDEFDFTIVNAARDLGATEFQALFKVIIPVMLPGIISAFLMSMTLSLDDYVVTSFVTGVKNSNTLPLEIYSMIRFGISPVINALSTILVFGTVILAVISRKFQKYMF